MEDIQHKKITDISANNISRTIAISFDNKENSLILKDVQMFYDTGVIGGRVIQINESNHLGSRFHADITFSGQDTKDYKWFQLKTDKGVFEAAIKTFELRQITESDLL